LRPFREFGYVPGVNRNDREANVLENLITLCTACHQRAEAVRGTRSALGGLTYALGNIAPLFLMCDPRDIGTMAETRGRGTRSPTITLYDRIPEGLGMADRLYEWMQQLLQGALDLVRGCGCIDGCPACVGPVGEGAADVKTLTARLLEELLAGSDVRTL
jgi:DEAD/DEAH box helicase domain-containing protein